MIEPWRYIRPRSTSAITCKESIAEEVNIATYYRGSCVGFHVVQDAITNGVIPFVLVTTYRRNAMMFTESYPNRSLLQAELEEQQG